MSRAGPAAAASRDPFGDGAQAQPQPQVGDLAAGGLTGDLLGMGAAAAQPAHSGGSGRAESFADFGRADSPGDGRDAAPPPPKAGAPTAQRHGSFGVQAAQRADSFGADLALVSDPMHVAPLPAPAGRPSVGAAWGAHGSRGAGSAPQTQSPRPPALQPPPRERGAGSGQLPPDLLGLSSALSLDGPGPPSGAGGQRSFGGPLCSELEGLDDFEDFQAAVPLP